MLTKEDTFDHAALKGLARFFRGGGGEGKHSLIASAGLNVNLQVTHSQLKLVGLTQLSTWLTCLSGQLHNVLCTEQANF